MPALMYPADFLCTKRRDVLVLVTKYRILNVDCPRCAAKIEESVSKLPGISSATVDFVNKTLVVDSVSEIDRSTAGDIMKKIYLIDHNAKVLPADVALQNRGKFFAGSGDVFSTKCRNLVEIFVSFLLLVSFLFLKDYNATFGLACAVLSVAVCGYRTFFAGILSVLRLKMDEKSLMTIAVISALIIGEVAESIIVILLFRVGEILEKTAITRSRRNIESLTKIMPDTAWLISKNTEIKISAEKINVGDILSIHPFDRVPCDGTVVRGTSYLDMSPITGESIPVFVSPGDAVMSGSINKSGLISVKSTKTATDSTASRILKLIEETAKNRSDTETIITRFALVYTPFVVAIALVMVLLFPFFGLGGIDVWLHRALVLLVASCPCAIVISVPLAFYYGIGKASRMGVLFKGGKYAETLATADIIVFDKTATLTTGILSVSNVHSFGKLKKDEILKISAAAEMYSAHPIAAAIRHAAGSVGTFVAKDHSELPGLGVRAIVGNDEILCGKRKLLEQNGIGTATIMDLPFYLAVNGEIVGGLDFSDTLRPESPETVRLLKKTGIKRLAILSGDSYESTKKVADACGISEFYYKLMPEDKVKVFEGIRKKSKKAVFVGDGINDTPTLTAADCGIAMGFGTKAAIEAGDVVLTTNNIKNIPRAILLSRRTMLTIKSNIAFSLVVKAAVLALAVFGIAPMWLAALADTGVTVLAVALACLPASTKYNIYL